jgi:hypothetical protein
MERHAYQPDPQAYNGSTDPYTSRRGVMVADITAA